MKTKKTTRIMAIAAVLAIITAGAPLWAQEDFWWPAWEGKANADKKAWDEMGRWFTDTMNYIATVYDEPIKNKLGEQWVTNLQKNKNTRLFNTLQMIIKGLVQEKDDKLVNMAMHASKFASDRSDQKAGVKFWKETKAAYQKALVAAQKAEREAAEEARLAQEKAAAAAKAEAERLAKLPVTEDDFQIRQDQYGTIIIDRYTGKATRVTIPTTISGVKVGSWSGAFTGNKRIVSVVIPEGYTEISSISSIYDEKGKKEKGRFEGCSSLESVQLPSTLKIIGAYAFMGCKLTSITIPNGVTSIGDGAFAGQYDSYNSYYNKRETYKENANRLQNLAIPDSVTYIGNSAFLQCGIQTLKLGNGLKNIENGAFAGNSLTDLTIPDSVTRIGRSRKGAKDSSFGQEEPGAFEGCGIQTLKLGKSVSIIGIAAFQGNKITELNLPASIKEIQGDAFASNNISALTIPNGVTRLGYGSFRGNSLTSLVIPPSLAEYKERESSNGRNEFGEERSFPVAGFAGAFNPKDLTSITLPANVDERNLKGFDADFLNFYQSQGRKAGTYVKKGRIWTVQ